ncbi:MAG: YihY/virulence factor BrkB family protein [Eubacteriaceae bacterium]
MINFTRIKEFTYFMFKKSQDHHVVNLSAQMSYRLLLAFIPFFMLLYNLIHWFYSELSHSNLDFLSNILPKIFIDYISAAQINAQNTPISLGSNLLIGFFILYVSIAAMHSLIHALNRIFGQEETRGFFALWFQSFLYLFLFIFVIFLTILFYFLGENIITFVFSILHIPLAFFPILEIFTFIYLLGTVAIVFTLIYQYSPKVHLKFFEALPGGLFVALGWMLLFFIYQSFVNSFLDFTHYLKDLQGPFSLCALIFLISLIITLGAIVNLYVIKKNKKKERGIHV